MSGVDPRVSPDPDVEGATGEETVVHHDKGPDADVDRTLDGPDIQHPTNWRIS